MAIFGNVADMPLPDVLTMVGRGTGRFFLNNLEENRCYELHLDRGMFSALLVDHDPVEDVFQVRNRMVELVNLRLGEFEFERQSATMLLSYFQLPIDMVLLASLAALDEVNAYRPYFPAEETVFQIQPDRQALLEGDLLAFWHSSVDLLQKGASAAQLAEKTSLFLDHILLCLHKLRAYGLIAPVRAYTQVQLCAESLVHTGALPKKEFAGPIGKILFRLHRALESRL